MIRLTNVYSLTGFGAVHDVETVVHGGREDVVSTEGVPLDPPHPAP